MQFNFKAAVLVLALAGCTADVTQSPRVYTVQNQLPTPPADLVALAESMRAQGGYVFVAESIGEREPSHADGPGPDANTFLRVREESADVVVSDALGATLPPTLRVLASAGPMEVVDESGEPSTGWIIHDVDDWTLHAFPSSGPHVYFVVPHDGEWFAKVVTPFTDAGLVEGRGTLNGEAMPLSALMDRD